MAQQQRAIAIQKQSVERQRATAGPPTPLKRPESIVWRGTSDPALGAHPPADCPPVAPMLLESLVHQAAATYHVPSTLVSAVIRQESGGYPCAVSEKGAMGLMQLMPETAARMGVAEPFDITQNVSGGTRLLGELMQRYKGDLIRVLGAYNAGTEAVDQAGGPPSYPETVNYIRSIMDQIKSPLDPKLFVPPIR